MASQPSIPSTSEMQCPRCNKSAELISLKVQVPGETDTLVSSLNCTHCSYQNPNTHDGNTGNGKGVFISCEFNTQEDLNRFVRLAEYANIKIEKDGAIFEFKCQVSGVYLVESIIKEVCNNYECHKDDDNLGDIVKPSFCDANCSGENSKEHAMKRVKVLKAILKESQFIMSVCDNTGTSRVAPVGKMLKDITSDKMEAFNDEKVRHASYKVETEDKR